MDTPPTPQQNKKININPQHAYNLCQKQMLVKMKGKCIYALYNMDE